MPDTRAPTGRVRPLEHADLAMIRAWRNHPAVRRVMYTNHEIGADEHAQWFERARIDPKRHLLVFESNGAACGFANFTLIGAGVADWGFYTAPDAPRGTGRALGNCTLAHGFATLTLHKIRGEVIAGNEASLRFHRQLGFREEGVLREQHFDGTRYRDVVCFGLLAHEWRALATHIGGSAPP